MTSDRLLEVENIRQQFRQDCMVLFKGHVFIANPVNICTLQRVQDLCDRDGFPIPLSGDDITMLNAALQDTWGKARKKFFERMGGMQLENLLEVKSVEDETTT